MEYYETHSKISSSSNRKMGRNMRQEYCKRSFSENSSSEESTSSPESNFSNEYPKSEESARFGKNKEVEQISDVSLSFSEEEE